MKAPQQGKQKQSRNRARKALYAAQADASSRNQSAIEKPIVGRIERVTEEVREILREDEDGTITVVGRKIVKVAPYDRVVHDGEKVIGEPNTIRVAKRATDARKRRRQESAWARCAAVRETGAHRGSDNCGCCGCPPQEQRT